MHRKIAFVLPHKICLLIMSIVRYMQSTFSVCVYVYIYIYIFQEDFVLVIYLHTYYQYD